MLYCQSGDCVQSVPSADGIGLTSLLSDRHNALGKDTLSNSVKWCFLEQSCPICNPDNERSTRIG